MVVGVVERVGVGGQQLHGTFQSCTCGHRYNTPRRLAGCCIVICGIVGDPGDSVCHLGRDGSLVLIP